ncbi:MAG: Ig-like domain-containing protein [Terracidiphilus sp.]
MRGIICRGLRLEVVAGLGIALAMPALAMAAENAGVRSDRSSSLGWNAQPLATQTAVTVETRDQDGRTQAIVAVTVTGEDGLPATGAVAISDYSSQLAGAALNAQGQASIVLDLPAGDHSLTAVYAGDATHQGSTSQASGAQAQASSTPNFLISVAPATLSLTPGQSGTVTASVTPQNSSALTAPMFVTLSCSGLPDQASCTFTPENVEILPNATAAITSSMVITTQLGSQGPVTSAAHLRSNSIAWAFLLPGALGLGGLAWGVRRRPWLNRLSLLALLGLVTMLGTTACNPRYDYEHHGPPPNPATPAGTYTVYVTAQSSNGVTAITNSTTMALTVK